MTIADAIKWVQDHGADILTIATSVVAAASAIAAVTPTPADNTFIGKIYKIIDWLALNVLKAKDKGQQ